MSREISQISQLDEEDTLSELPTKRKVVAAPHKKSKVIRSYKQVLREIAQNLKIYL